MDMQRLFLCLLAFLHLPACHSQTETAEKPVGGPCEGCEAIYEYRDRPLTSVDTLPAFQENAPKLKVTGKIYKRDGKTPAGDVIVYIYHTNRKGIYQTTGDESGWAKRHGRIRGWIKTDDSGAYTFYTFRPAAYPDGREPEHIHMVVTEPGKKEYYIDSIVFTDDPLLTQGARKQREDRGGSGVVRPVYEQGLWVVERDIVLGRNIPNY